MYEKYWEGIVVVPQPTNGSFDDFIAYEDKYFEEEDDFGSFIVEYLMSFLNPLEKEIVSMLIFDNEKMYTRKTKFVVFDGEGKPVFDKYGNLKTHDHKWVQRRLKDAVKKMVLGIEELPEDLRPRFEGLKSRLISND